MVKRIPIFYASDENYAAPLTVSMFSVLSNTKQHIDFYILENNIKRSTKKKMRKSLDRFSNHTLQFISVDMDKVKDFPNLQWYSLNMYSRYFIPELCNNIDKCIYLDVDIIVKHDIADLFSIDLDGCAIGAVIGEPNILKEQQFQNHIKNLGLDDKHIYFGSGVLVFSANQWRRNNLCKKLVTITADNKNVLKYPDQDALNILFNNNKYKQLDLQWNRDLNQIQQDLKKDSMAIDKCHLIHFDGPAKPWTDKCFCDEFFWQYAINTMLYQKPTILELLWSYIRYKFCITQKRKKYKKKYKQNKRKLEHLS